MLYDLDYYYFVEFSVFEEFKDDFLEFSEVKIPDEKFHSNNIKIE